MTITSLPSRERGSKRLQGFKSKSLRIVAPLAGAWIETPLFGWFDCCIGVSLPSRERGLKPAIQSQSSEAELSLPSRERGSKRDMRLFVCQGGQGRSPRGSVDRNALIMIGLALVITSLPSRERGSKHRRVDDTGIDAPSLPSRERGSKRQLIQKILINRHVAPLAGAWIETEIEPDAPQIRGRSLPSRERGSKQPAPRSGGARYMSLPSPSVDRNLTYTSPSVKMCRRRSPRGSVDRNIVNGEGFDTLPPPPLRRELARTNSRQPSAACAPKQKRPTRLNLTVSGMRPK